MDLRSFGCTSCLSFLAISGAACGGSDTPMNPAGPQTHTVQALANNTFSPATLTIRVGDTVRWENAGGGMHNVAANDGSFRCSNGCDGAGGNGDPSTANWQFSRVFSAVGTIDYNCETHVAVGMTGRVTVQ